MNELLGKIVKTQGPGVLNEDQESRDAIQLKKFTEGNCLQFQAEVSFNTPHWSSSAALLYNS